MLREQLEEKDQEIANLRDELANMKQQLREAKAESRKRTREGDRENEDDVFTKIQPKVFETVLSVVRFATEQSNARINELEDQVNRLEGVSRQHSRDISRLYN